MANNLVIIDLINFGRSILKFFPENHNLQYPFKNVPGSYPLYKSKWYFCEHFFSVDQLNFNKKMKIFSNFRKFSIFE